MTQSADRGDTLAYQADGASDPSGLGWQRVLAQAVTSSGALREQLGLASVVDDSVSAAERDFPVVAPRPFVERMEYGNPADPLLRQVLVDPAEAAVVAGFGPDPVGESICSMAPGLLHKYHGRALLVTTGTCAIHCRYCFRRHYPYQETSRRGRWWQVALAQVAADPSVSEIIWSGCDPLVLPNAVLGQLLADCRTVPHLKRLRIHTRLPVVIPQRVDQGLLDVLGQWPTSPVMVLHINHAQEFDAAVDQSCRRLREAGVCLLNQAVLLAGVNDGLKAQVELSERSHQAGVLPYYLHQLDPVAGAAHFAVTDADAVALHRAMQAHLPGYLVPKLVREIPGAVSKTLLPRLDGSAAS